MTIFTPIYTRLKGELVGTDGFGNRYYRERGGLKTRPDCGRERRWVLYAGAAEASTVPAEWHGWLHYYSDVIPTEGAPPQRSWQKEHVPNRTGTPEAYRPPGHDFQGGQRARAIGDYEPWRPD